MNNKLFVGGLPWSTDDQALKDAFASYGAVKEASVVKDRETGRSRGFGFVTFETEEAAKAALDGMTGKAIGGRSITVREATDRPGRGGPPPGGRGGFGDRPPRSPRGPDDRPGGSRPPPRDFRGPPPSRTGPPGRDGPGGPPRDFRGPPRDGVAVPPGRRPEEGRDDGVRFRERREREREKKRDDDDGNQARKKENERKNRRWQNFDPEDEDW